MNNNIGLNYRIASFDGTSWDLYTDCMVHYNDYVGLFLFKSNTSLYVINFKESIIKKIKD